MGDHKTLNKRAQACNSITETVACICQESPTQNFHAPIKTKSTYASPHPRHRGRHSFKSVMSYMLSEFAKAIVDVDAKENKAARKRAKKAREEARKYDKKLDELSDAVGGLRTHAKRVKMSIGDLKDDLRYVEARVTEEFADLNRRVTDLERSQERE